MSPRVREIMSAHTDAAARLRERMATRHAAAVRVGLISDTHGLLRPEALGALRGSDVIVHAGDVGDPTIVNRLAELAPVTLVRGNVDRVPEAAAWPDTAVLEIGGVRLFVLHDLATLRVNPAKAGYGAVIYGHSHKPASERRGDVLYVNPGSAGPRRFQLPVSLGTLRIRGTRIVAAQIIDLEV